MNSHEELKLSRRRRKKMAKVQQRKLYKEFRKEKHHRTALYKHLIANHNSIKILEYLNYGFEKDLFLASLNNLSDKGNPLRFNNFAYCMREIITLILSRYSSDEDILKCCWYKNETNNENGVTRAQRVKYAIQGGLSDDRVFEVLELDEDDDKEILSKTLTEFTKSFRELNEHTHLREKRFNIGDELCENLASKVLGVMKRILMLIEDLRIQIKLHVEGEISDVLITEFIDTTFDDLDILSSHSVVDYSQVDDHYVDSICSEHVKISVDGTVFCELQWGSGSDMRDGIGASMSESFPYQAVINAKLEDLKKLELGEEGINLNTASWYE